MTQSAPHKHLFLADLEWLVIPPVLLSQYRIFRVQDRPVGVALWAFLTEEAEARVKAGNPRLRPDEWKAGDRAWLIDLIAPFGKPEVMLQDLRETVFKGKTLQSPSFHGGGKTAQTKTLPGEICLIVRFPGLCLFLLSSFCQRWGWH